jgi:hypothetical protein
VIEQADLCTVVCVDLAPLHTDRQSEEPQTWSSSASNRATATTPSPRTPTTESTMTSRSASVPGPGSRPSPRHERTP